MQVILHSNAQIGARNRQTSDSFDVFSQSIFLLYFLLHSNMHLQKTVRAISSPINKGARDLTYLVGIGGRRTASTA